MNKESIIDLNEINPTKIFQKLEETTDYFLCTRTQKAWELLLSKEYSKSVTSSQVILDRAWEHLNTGYWKDVKFIWRQLYSFASLMKCICLYNMDEFESALKACDMGLLMGAPIFENILSVVATKLSRCCKRDGISKHAENVNVEPLIKKVREDGIESSLDSRFLIEKINAPSLIQFQEKYMKLEKPVILTNCMKHWPAFSHNKWSIEYLKNIAGSRTVPVEIGDKYTSENWTQKLMTINEFIDRYISAKSNTGYLAQHQLFDQIPELKDDIITPDYCYVSEREGDDNIVLTHAWFGPKGTVSPLHHDPYQNILAQVMGSKYIRLYNKNSRYIYPNEDSILDNTSQVDLENIDLQKFPNFKDNEYHECILEAGEMLFIPLKWWHFVKSLSTSFSVSFWWK